MNYDWSDLAFADKKPLKSLQATFVAAPREISPQRFTQIIKALLPHSDIILGIAKEDYIEGFENQPQFKTLKKATVDDIVQKVNKSTSKTKIYVLEYFQREAPFIIEKLKLKRAIFINGSWKFAFHNTPLYYAVINARIAYEHMSPFVDEAEAKAYARDTMHKCKIAFPHTDTPQTEEAMLSLAEQASKMSFDYNFQTGATLGRRIPKTDKYDPITYSFNKVVPYQTYAMHHGALREVHFSPPNDLNHYDTIHAEVGMILSALDYRTDLKGTTLFINLMPCPICARMISDTDISEIVYSLDHSDGYAVKLLNEAGKKVRRIVA